MVHNMTTPMQQRSGRADKQSNTNKNKDRPSSSSDDTTGDLRPFFWDVSLIEPLLEPNVPSSAPVSPFRLGGAFAGVGGESLGRREVVSMLRARARTVHVLIRGACRVWRLGPDCAKVKSKTLSEHYLTSQGLLLPLLSPLAQPPPC
jgi:hypothetical protein